MFNHTCTLEIIITKMFTFNPCMEKIYSIINNEENGSLWNVIYVANGAELAKFVTVLPICVSKIHKFLIFNQNLIKLSLTCSFHFLLLLKVTWYQGGLSLIINWMSSFAKKVAGKMHNILFWDALRSIHISFVAFNSWGEEFIWA